MSQTTDSVTCGRCGAEVPTGLITYFVQVAPGTTGLSVKANENPVRARRAGLCKRCATAIVAYAAEDGAHSVAFTNDELIRIIVRIQKDPEFAARWTRVLEIAQRQAAQNDV